MAKKIKKSIDLSKNIDNLLTIKKVLLGKMVDEETYTDFDLAESKILLEGAAILYYGPGESILSDTDYDALVTEHHSYQGYPEINLTQKVEGGKITHSTKGLLGTLGNVFNIKELMDWIHKRLKHANLHILQMKHLCVSLKYDGCSAAMDIEDDVIEKAYSRGDEGEGQDYTHIFRGNINISEFGYNKATIKFEVVMSWDDFDEVNDMRKRDGKESFANPRSAVAGLLAWKDITEEYIVMLTVIPLMIEGMAKDVESRISGIGNHSYGYKLEILNKLSLEDCLFFSDRFFYMLFTEENGEYYVRGDGDKNTLQDCIDTVAEWRNDPDKLAFMVDGLVIDLIDDDARKDLGHYNVDGKSCPRFAIAMKFPYKSAETTLKTFEFDLADSKSGRLTPCCTFEPVTIDNREFTRVSLSNMNRIRQETWFEGQKVMLTIRADVLGYISPVLGEDCKGLKEIAVPEICPVCDAALEYNNTESWLFCSSETCPSKVTGKMLNYLRRMRIKGIAIKTLRAMTEMEYISTIKDLYEFSDHDLSSELGFGEGSAKVIVDAIDARKEVYDYEFFGAWNWPGVGRSMMKLVLATMTPDALMSITNPREFSSTIKQIEGFKDKRTRVLWKGLNEDRDEINYLRKGHIKLKNTSETKASGKAFKFVITGALVAFPDRNSLKMRLDVMGHKMTGGISGKTDYLVTNDTTSGTVKNKRANELNVPIINEAQFRKLVGI